MNDLQRQQRTPTPNYETVPFLTQHQLEQLGSFHLCLFKFFTTCTAVGSPVMDFIFQDFSTATAEGNGYQLAQTLSPELPAETLKIIWNSTNHNDARGYIRRNLKNVSSPLKVSNQEIDAWTDVFLSYWTAVGAILAVQGDIIAPGKPSWASVYQAWKDMTLFLKRGYQEFGFEAWTIPCLYTAGKYLRVFAIKADDERGLNAADSGAAALGDDFDPEMEAHQTLEECARHLNGLFSLCLTDRCVHIGGRTVFDSH